jgi:hypothetical protein
LHFIISAEKIRIINQTKTNSLVKYYATVFSGIIAALLISSFVSQAHAADLRALLVPTSDKVDASYIGVRLITLEYPAGSSLSQALDGQLQRISFTLNGTAGQQLNGTAGQQDETGVSQLINSINAALLEANSPAQATAVTVSYSAVLRGDPMRTTISYKTEIEPTLENYVLEVQGSSQIIDLEWRGIAINNAVVLNAPEIGEIDVNHPVGLLQALYPDLADKLLNSQARDIFEEPILNFKPFDFPMASWHRLFDPVGAYGGVVDLQGTEGASVLTVYSYGEGSIREGVHLPEEKDASANIDGANAAVHSSTPPPSGQITVAGYSDDQESGGTEFATVTADAPAGVQTATGGFPIQVLLILGGMMGAVAIFVLLKARK